MRSFAEVDGLDLVDDDATDDPSDESKLVSNDYPARKEERGVVTCMVDQVASSNFSQPHPEHVQRNHKLPFPGRSYHMNARSG